MKNYINELTRINGNWEQCIGITQHIDEVNINSLHHFRKITENIYHVEAQTIVSRGAGSNVMRRGQPFQKGTCFSAIIFSGQQYCICQTFTVWILDHLWL